METLEQFHQRHVDFVKHLYAENDDPDYDMLPFLASLMTIDGEPTLVMHAIADGHPLEMAHKIIHKAHTLNAQLGTINPKNIKADDYLMVSFAVAIWRKDPEDPRVRTGEGVMLVSETHAARHVTMFDCRREPLPTLYELTGTQAPAEMHPRLPLLYDPNHTEH